MPARRAAQTRDKGRVSDHGHDVAMGIRVDPAHDARRVAERLRRELGAELRFARLGAGLSQVAVGAAAGMSHAQVGRIERGRVAGLSLDQASRAASAVGLRLVVRTYPDGDPVRDAGQLALLARLRSRLPPAARWETEVPLPIPGDRRAWDALIRLGGRRAGCEAETRVRDVQALERRLALKRRDGAVDVVILVVAGTAANRRTLAAHREALRAILPLDGREVLASLRAAQLPARSGLVVL
jgi:transcriptional regulator with XRE-family HTH domain